MFQTTIILLLVMIPPTRVPQPGTSSKFSEPLQGTIDVHLQVDACLCPVVNLN